MLVHMAPREVAGLQSLAMAHGGSLTINPTTGLPEAGFLSNLLPTLIGAGLSIASGGALTPLMAAGITGAGYGVASGSLKKGLMAGLGAYGGAGLGSGLSAAGAAEASIPGAAPVSAEAATSFTTDPSAYSKFAPTESSFGAFGEAKGALASTPTGGSSLFGTVTNEVGQPLSFEAAVPAPTTPMATVTPAPSSYSPAYGTESARNAFQSQAADATMTDNFKQAGRGLKSLVDSPAGRDAFLGQAAKDGVEATGVGGLKGLAKYGTAALANPLLTPPSGSGYKSDSEQYKYEYDVGRNPDPQGSYTGAPTGERQWFAPKFRRLYAEGGQTKSSEDALRYLTSTDPTGRTNDLTGASRQAYDYLMGNGPGYRPQIQTQSSLPKARILTDDGGGGGDGGGGASSSIGTASVGNTPSVEIDPYDQAGQDAVSKLEREVAEETQYDREGQDAIDKYETEVEQERYDQEGQDAIDKYETEVEQERYDQEGQDAIDRYMSDSMPELEPPPFEPDNSGFYNSEFNASRDIDDATIAVDVPNDGVTAMDNGNTQVDMDPIVQQQPAAQTTVQDTPDGGAVVTMPDTTVTPDTKVAETPVVETPVVETPVVETPVVETPVVETPVVETPVVETPVVETPVVETPDGGAVVTVPDVEVGNAGGDFGDSGGYDGFIGDDDNIDEDRYDYAGNANGGLMGYAMGGMPGYATGGISNLGGYSDGGRLLRGPGDGVSDSIPAMIGKKQPARLADGEFVIPARIVSELGNGSTDAGARKLYAMMDRIQAARKKTTGKNRVAVNSRADKMMPV
jgi:hypothetical protein